MPKVSIVLPVYNTSKYLSDCLNSIFSQTYKDFVVYAVDDGSTDNSLEILQKYQSKESRLIVLSQLNQGAASARNAALKLIYKNCEDNDYVLFFDSDDLIDEGCLQKCIQEMEGADLLIFGLRKFTQSGFYSSGRLVPAEVTLNQEQLCDYYFRLNDWVTGTTVTLNGLCNKCFKLSVLRDKFFDASLRIAEDQDFFINLIPQIKRAKVIPDPFYLYRMRSSSLTHVEKKMGFTDDFFVHQKYIDKKDLPSYERYGIQHRYIESIWSDLHRSLVSKNNLKQKSDFYKLVKSALQKKFEFQLTSKDKKRLKIMRLGFFLNLIYAYLKLTKEKRKQLDL
jgi:glycosyltransferase involved in cell wall biosynthesis